MRYSAAAGLAILAGISAAFGQQPFNCGVPRKRSSENYIFQGNDALPGEFPWQVSLQGYAVQLPGQPNGWSHNCGASIINRRWLLTAAHCVDPRFNPFAVRAALGAYDISRREESVSYQRINFTRDVVMHPRWDVNTLDFDYALIQLPQALDFTGEHSHLTSICMPRPDQAKVFENMQCTVTGWGRINARSIADVLQKLPVRVPTHEECSRLWMSGGPLNRFPLTPRHICAATIRGEGSGVCHGDSGGPLQCVVDGRSYLAGIASFVRYCGSSSHPNVYARVTEVLDWIERVQVSRS